MRLIKIAGFVDSVENGNTLLQEVRRVSRAFDLTQHEEAVGMRGISLKNSLRVGLSGVQTIVSHVTPSALNRFF